MLCFGVLLMWCNAQSPPAATAGATFCELYSPVLWSKQDTRKTKEQVDQLNRVWKTLCKDPENAAKN